MTFSSLWSWAAGWLGADRGRPHLGPHQSEDHPAPASEGSSPGPGGKAAAATSAIPAPPTQSQAALAVPPTGRGRAAVVGLVGGAGTDTLRTREFALARVLARRVPLAVPGSLAGSRDTRRCGAADRASAAGDQAPRPVRGPRYRRASPR